LLANFPQIPTGKIWFGPIGTEFHTMEGDFSYKYFIDEFTL
jgi:hypothetical protein